MTSSASSISSLSLAVSSMASSSFGVQHSGPVHFGHLITAKLSPATHLFWRAQVVSQLRSHLLYGYVDGTFPCPPAMVETKKEGGETVSSPNPDHVRWIQQDQAILNAFLASSSIETGGLITFAKTS